MRPEQELKPYRRGLILGLTLAEVMILLIFILLMALASALAKREKQLADSERRLAAVDSGFADQLVEKLQQSYPTAKSDDDYFKELVKAIEARRALEQAGGDKQALQSKLMENAALGERVKASAEKAGAADPFSYAIAAMEKSKKGKKGEWPPFFNLSEAGGYYFDSGKATLRPEFEARLKSKIIPMLQQNIEDYGVEIVEVTGFTDEVPMKGTSNLDALLIKASQDLIPTEALRSTDNAGLAMARAVAVVKILRADKRLKGATILPLSGAQMIVPVDKIANGTQTASDQNRRRIEIRLRRTTEAVKSEAAKA